MSAPVFVPHPRWLHRSKQAMAVIDAAAVLLVLADAMGQGSPHPVPVGALALAMFVWHRAENVAWPARWSITGAPLYPAGQAWIHGVYSLVLTVAAIDVLTATGEIGTPPLAGAGPQGLGCVLFLLGAGLRLAAFSQRGASFLAAPEVAGPPPHRGVYVYTRHPGAVGSVAIAVGSALALGSAVAVAVAAIAGGWAATTAARRERAAWRSR